jgi:anion-transporting  ArsA/GET3 family ATPase
MAKLQTQAERAERQRMLDCDLLYVTGKGGVGKTTVALALALLAARQGRRVILCEVAGQARAQALFGYDGAPPGREVALEAGLWALSIDPALALEEWAARQIRSRRLVHLLTGSSVFGNFVNAAPGVRELLAITKAWELARPERWVRSASRYDLVVLDAPSSGHGLGVLRTPRTFAEIARVGPIASQARAVRELLEDPLRSAYVAVALPAELPVSETLDLEARLHDQMRRELATIVVNGVLPRRFTATELEAIARARRNGDAGRLPSAAFAAAHDLHGQANAQQAQLRRLRRHAGAPVHTLPFVFTTALHLDDVRLLADALEREL